MITQRENLAWIAGVFDGEGWIHVDRYTAKGGTRKSVSLTMGVGQAHREMLDRIVDIVGLGTIYGPRSRAGRKPFYVWRTSRFEGVQATTAMIWPWLGSVKRGQLVRALEEAKTHRRNRPSLTLPQVAEIRLLLKGGKRPSDIAAAMRCDVQAIWRISQGRTYCRGPEEMAEGRKQVGLE